MELKQLRQFVAIAESGSFVRAAEEIGLAQPPLSVSIKKLEAELETQLFERHARGASLTPAGEAMFKPACDILTRAANLKRLIREMQSGQFAKLRIGFVGSATFSLLPRLIRTFKASYPLVDVELTEMTSQKAMSLVEEGKIDIGILRLPLLQPTNLTILPVEEDRLILMVPPNHRLRNAGTVRLEDLRTESFIMYDQATVPNLRALAIMACQSANFMPHIVLEATQVNSIAALVESGLGIALLPSIVRSRWQRTDQLLDITSSGSAIKIELGLAVAPDHESRAVEWFCNVGASLRYSPPE